MIRTLRQRTGTEDKGGPINCYQSNSQLAYKNRQSNISSYEDFNSESNPNQIRRLGMH